MNEAGSIAEAERAPARPIFVSYATADRKEALSVCRAIERRGLKCWISTRDVAPGENYQEAIVRALRQAPAMVLLFSSAANSSDEIKKELSLASRYRIPVIALRIEEFEPTDAFAYELSTRQWIDVTKDREQSIDTLVDRLAQLSDAVPAAGGVMRTAQRPPFSLPTTLMAVAAVVILTIAVGGWWWFRPGPAAAHSMSVRLAGFRALSSDLPGRMHDALDSEITAAFNADGVIGVSTAPLAPGDQPAYALGGTIDRVGNSIRVITQFTNERSGAILWSDSVDYPADQAARIPRGIAVDAGTVVRCGLFGASTYRKALPDAVFGNYMQYCRGYWAFDGSKTLHFAQRVVAAVPDFSWGWSAVANGYMQSSELESDDNRAAGLRAAGRRAEAKALSLDPKNSEALAHDAYLIDSRDWVGQETLFKNAIAAKPLDCGCEHYGYGLLLAKVGRLKEAVVEFRAATDMLALWPDSQRGLADTLVAMGQIDEAKAHFETAIELSKDPDLAGRIAVTEAIDSGEHAPALIALRNPRFGTTPETRAPLIAGFEALKSHDPGAKANAIRALLAIPATFKDERVATMLGALGANRDALEVANRYPSTFWRPSMRAALNEPIFPPIANQLGLMKYWRATHTKPDVCSTKGPPPFCRMI